MFRALDFADVLDSEGSHPSNIEDAWTIRRIIAGASQLLKTARRTARMKTVRWETPEQEQRRHLEEFDRINAEQAGILAPKVEPSRDDRAEVARLAEQFEAEETRRRLLGLGM